MGQVQGSLHYARNLAKRQIPDSPRAGGVNVSCDLALERRVRKRPRMMLGNTGLELGNYLTYLTRREEVIASNIANADTPGYKTRDIDSPGDFSSILHSAALTVEAPGLPSRNDGNNVSIDREAKLLAENSLRFNLATQMLRGEFKDIRSAIEEGRA